MVAFLGRRPGARGNGSEWLVKWLGESDCTWGKIDESDHSDFINTFNLKAAAEGFDVGNARETIILKEAARFLSAAGKKANKGNKRILRLAATLRHARDRKSVV